ncbi:hypothetical protein [Geopsychrobacter electrodiphilus]|uniref:hypothetical protein n=1 Tax=Geopsychrobacter electrodiphilus TaxID=225196 RepID=UPI000375AD48|nr:hypothetical protein [Geopsychrobacter electrodiphilus]
MKISDLFEKHKLVRRLSLLWAVLLISWVVIQVFTHINLINSAVATALGIVVGLLTTVLGLYQHHRHKEDKNA